MKIRMRIRYWFFAIIITFSVLSCSDETSPISEGIWLAELKVIDDESLPFNFKCPTSTVIVLPSSVLNQ